MILAACHSLVVVEEDEDGQTDSPDRAANVVGLSANVVGLSSYCDIY